jgi:hypothetical protein
MRVFDKICPVCNNQFEAKRRNQIYCSSTCRADINNDKLKTKFNSIKTLEKMSQAGEHYKSAFLSAARVVEIEFDSEQNHERYSFEGRKFERIAYDIDVLREYGISLGEKSVDGNKRVAIYIPHRGLLCFLKSYILSARGLTYRLIKKNS